MIAKLKAFQHLKVKKMKKKKEKKKTLNSQ